ncbi:MAG: PAS domain S-box protein, partial [Nitrospirota bacterium]
GSSGLIRAASTFFQEKSGCEAVGIRLHDGDDYPYYEARGFPKEFVKMENSLCACDDSGVVIRDNIGNPVLACMCGNVICGRFDTSKPFFTAGGSFWSNCTTELLVSTTETDRKVRTRNRCNGEGYESVALIPMKIGEDSLGLIQLNDRRKGMFTPEAISEWEKLVGYLAVALAKFRAEEELIKYRDSLEELVELRTAEAHESGKRYRMLFDTIDEGFCIVQMIFDENDKPVDYRFLEVNPSFERQTGIVDAQGKSMREIAPKHEEHWFEIYGRIALTGEPERFENRAEQLHRWYDVYAFRFGQPENRQVAILFNDITERKRSEEAVRESEERLRLMIKNATDYAFVILDTEGRVIFWNEGAQRIKGYAPEEILGKDFRCFYTEEDIRSGKPARELEMAASKGSLEEEGLRVRKDGTRFWANVVITALRDEAGNLKGYSKLTRDITERKRAEEEIRNLNQDLERRVLLRTAELTVSNKELEAFSYSVSHDLRAPLRHVQGFVDLLRKNMGATADEKSTRLLNTIAAASSQMGSLIDDLLAFSRMGRSEMHSVNVNLGSLVDKVIQDIGDVTKGRKITWKVGKLPPVQGDPSMLKLAVENLISNAVKFTRKEPDAVIEVGSYPGDDGEAVFYVRDNGVGFDMQYVDKLFGVFQRLHKTEEFEGTGIGLANVRRIISRHGGKTWAEGSVGNGATIYFTLGTARKETQP